MNMDLDILRATFGDLVLQAVSLQSQIKALQDEKAKADLAKAIEQPAGP